MNEQRTDCHGLALVNTVTASIKSCVDTLDRYTIDCLARLKEAFRPNSGLTGFKREASRFANLWKSGGAAGKGVLVWAGLTLLLALLALIPARRTESDGSLSVSDPVVPATLDHAPPRMSEPDDILRGLRR